METAHLIVFAKIPELGTAKTRLAKDTSDEFALDVYQDLLLITLNASEQSGIPLTVFWNKESDISHPFTDFPSDVQQGKDLGDKIKHAFQAKLKEGNRKVLLIGSDCPELTDALLHQALAELDQHEVVLGPSEDGGYYLVGIRQTVPPIFQGRQWSHDKVLAEAIETLEGKGISYALLPTLFDIDTLEDYKKWIGEESGNASCHSS